MIQPRELRIGNRLRPNHVIDLENIPLLGYQICAGHLAYSQQRLNYDWGPILLTYEVLEKIGFEPFKDGQKMKISESLFLWRGDWERIVYLCFDNGTSYPLYLNPPVYHFQFLHQLQNLYFSLTGSELEINA